MAREGNQHSRKSVSLSRMIIPCIRKRRVVWILTREGGSENTHETRSTISFHNTALCTGWANVVGMWFPRRSAATGDIGKRTTRHAHHHHSFARIAEAG